jgi:hypothetical protein
LSGLGFTCFKIGSKKEGDLNREENRNNIAVKHAAVKCSIVAVRMAFPKNKR